MQKCFCYHVDAQFNYDRRMFIKLTTGHTAQISAMNKTRIKHEHQPKYYRGSYEEANFQHFDTKNLQGNYEELLLFDKTSINCFRSAKVYCLYYVYVD